MGAEGKEVVFMRRSFRRNKLKHDDLGREDYEVGLGRALYLHQYPIFQDKDNKEYWHFIGEPLKKGKSGFDLILDNSALKKNIEVVHFHKRKQKEVRNLLKKYGLIK